MWCVLSVAVYFAGQIFLASKVALVKLSDSLCDDNNKNPGGKCVQQMFAGYDEWPKLFTFQKLSLAKTFNCPNKSNLNSQNIYFALLESLLTLVSNETPKQVGQC